MTRALPFTTHSLIRAIKAVEGAGRFVVGVRPDGILLVSEKPFDVGSLAAVPAEPQNPPPPTRRMGEFFNGGESEA